MVKSSFLRERGAWIKDGADIVVIRDGMLKHLRILEERAQAPVHGLNVTAITGGPGDDNVVAQPSFNISGRDDDERTKGLFPLPRWTGFRLRSQTRLAGGKLGSKAASQGLRLGKANNQVAIGAHPLIWPGGISLFMMMVIAAGTTAAAGTCFLLIFSIIHYNKYHVII